jgi:hypothetical protein
VDTSEIVDAGLFDVAGLIGGYTKIDPTNTNPDVTIKAKSKLNIDSVAIKFVIEQFGVEKSVTELTYVIRVGSYKPTDKIVIESGVQLYDNVYLSLLGVTSTSDPVKEYIVAYATNANGDATYAELGFEINKFNGESYNSYEGTNLSVAYDEATHTFTLAAKEGAGGVYELVIYAKDSESDEDGMPIVARRVKITVSDGKAENTAYLIGTIDEFVAMAEVASGKVYYRLSNDIDLSLLTDDNWWGKSRQFKGELNGQMVIESLDKNNPFVLARNYVLKNLTVSKVSSVDEDNIGLFNNIVEGGVIKNVIFENARLYIGGESEISNNTVNAGVIAAVNNGTIENCSVMLAISYDDKTQKVILKNKAGTQVSEFDATAFIKDGMLDDATYNASTNKITLTWNTEAGKSAMEIDLNDLVDTYTGGNGINVATDGVISINDGIVVTHTDLNTTVGALEDQITAAQEAAETYADGKADAAETAAKTYADGKASAAEAAAKTYADGKASAA